ncbi:MAG: radical SAM protein [Methanosarcinaceae archaeon]|nr:radical SAM protein [Methanosarcinaceae archaeon]
MKCNICEIGCEISEQKGGRCGTYVSDGTLIHQKPGLSYLGAFPISIESVPLLHFYPSGKFLQIFGTGCNFRCPGCVTRLLSTGKNPSARPVLSPSQVVEKALQEDCLGIVSTMNEPAANYYLFRELAKQAKAKGLLTGCSTNCYFTAETLEEFGQFVDFVNVGIKGSSEETYRACGVPSPNPVFRNIGRLFELGVHVETSVVYSKGRDEDVINVAKTLAEISPSIPVQVMRFLPFGEAPIELEPSIGASEKLCAELRKHMDYVYLFNSPGTEFLHTYCPECGRLLAEREFHGPMGARSVKPWINQTCTCGTRVPVTGTSAPESFSEAGFLGGYRISRAFGMVHAVLTCLGLSDDQTLLKTWKKLSDSESLMQIHHQIQTPLSYLEFVRFIAEKANVPEKGEELVSFLQARLELVRGLALENSGNKDFEHKDFEHKDFEHKDSGHKVYYCMGSPLFALNAGRMENNLVEFAGGISINKQLQQEGKPGVNVSPSFINKENPETIFISGFLSRPLEEFYALCRQYGIDADAVKNRRVYAVPPSWDFGSPRWILGLLYIADRLHPEKSEIFLRQEADEFYLRFYGTSFGEARPNRSFHRPTSGPWSGHIREHTHA